jgi:GNAT superfamily N-acetyltransferase
LPLPLDQVRIAGVADERALYDLLVDMWTYNSRGWGFPYSPEIVVRHIQEGTRTDLAQRSDPNDRRRAIIGVIDGETNLAATIGLFLDPPVWFTDSQVCVIPTELWFYIRPEARGKNYERALRDFALDIRDKLRRDVKGFPMPLATGFMHMGKRYGAMQHFWERLWPKARQVGSLFWID